MSANPEVKIMRRPAEERGRTQIGWLDSRHSFSFGEYLDLTHKGFRSLRVINEDWVAPSRGFPTHPHQNMEIFTYVVSGKVAHRDSMGNGREVGAGEFQSMSAGTGVRHSEMNPSATETLHLLQIWILPDQPGGEPRYGELGPVRERLKDGLALLASRGGRDGSLPVRQDAEVFFGSLGKGEGCEMAPDAALPNAWIQVIVGELLVGRKVLGTGDGAALEGGVPRLEAREDAEFLLFRLA